MTTTSSNVDPLVEKIRQMRAARAGKDPLVDRIAQIRAARAAQSPDVADRVVDTAASLGIGLISGIPQAVGQTARMVQSGMAAARNPVQALGTAAASGFKLLSDPIGVVSGMEGVAPGAAAGQAVAGAIDEAAMSVPTNDAGSLGEAVNQVAGQVAEQGTNYATALGAAAPIKSREPFSPESIALSSGQSVPQMGASIATGILGGMLGGPPGAAIGAFLPSLGAETAANVEQNFQRLREANPGMDEEEALTRSFLPAIAAGVPSAMLDSASGGEAAAVKGVLKSNTADVARSFARKVLEGAKVLGKAGLEEMATEPIQGTLSDIGGVITQPPTSFAPEDVTQFGVRRGMEAAVGGAMGGAGGVVGAAGEFKGSKAPKPSVQQQETAKAHPTVTTQEAPPAPATAPMTSPAVQAAEARLRARNAPPAQPAPAAQATPAPAAVDDPTARVLADLGIDPADFAAKVQAEGDKDLIEQDPAKLTPEMRQRRNAAIVAELRRRADAFEQGGAFRAEEARKAEMLAAGRQQEEDARRQKRVDRKQARRNLRNPGEDEGFGQPALPEVQPQSPSSVDPGSREEVTQRLETKMAAGMDRSAAFNEVQQELTAEANARMDEDGAILVDIYGDEYQVSHERTEKGGPKNKRALIKLTEDGKRIEDPNQRPWINPDDAILTARGLRPKATPTTALSPQPLSSESRPGVSSPERTPESEGPSSIAKILERYNDPDTGINQPGDLADQIRFHLSESADPDPELQDALDAFDEAQAQSEEVAGIGGWRGDNGSDEFVAAVERAAAKEQSQPQPTGAESPAPTIRESRTVQPGATNGKGQEKGRQEGLLSPTAMNEEPRDVAGASTPTKDRYVSAFGNDEDESPFVVEDTQTGNVVGKYRTNDEAEAASRRLNNPDAAAPKEPWEMTRREYRETDQKLIAAAAARDKAQSELGGSNRWGESRRFQGKSSGLRLERLDSANKRWSTAFDAADAKHGKMVSDAIAAGKPVPAEVLAEYPDLSPPPSAKGQEPSPTGSTAPKPFDPEKGLTLGEGDTPKTSSGRTTTPFPKLDFGSEAKTRNTLRRTTQWLIDNAVAEAKSRGDDFNAPVFERMTPKNVSDADRASLNEYLFGEQPPVLKPITKPLVEPSGPNEELLKAASPTGQVARLRDRAAKMIAKAESLERNSSRRFDSAPGAFVTGASGRDRSGLNKKTNRAIEGSLNDLQRAKRMREAASRWNARADRLDPDVIARRDEQRDRKERAIATVKSQESEARKSAPLINEGGEGVVSMTSAEWATTHNDYKGVDVRDGYKVRTVVRGGTLSEVFLTDKPVKTRADVRPATPKVAPATPEVARSEGTAKSLGLKDAPILRTLHKTIRNGWHYAESPNGAVLIHPSEDRAVRFEASNERSGSQMLRARTEAQAYAQDNPVQAEKQAWQMDHAEFARQPDEWKQAQVQQVADRTWLATGQDWVRLGETRKLHQTFVKYAAAKGDIVPSVLAEYPRLQQRYGGELVVKPIFEKPGESTLSPEKEARLAELKKRLAAKLNTELRSGFDPEMFAIGAEMTALYVEKGVKTFAAFAKRMVAELGDAVKPYLKSFYNGARDMPGVDATGMDSADTVSKADIEDLLAAQSPQTPGDTLAIEAGIDLAELNDTRQKAAAVVIGPLNPDRVRKRKEIADKMYGTGASQKNRIAVVILGPPAAGKSTAGKVFTEKLGALEIDSDIAKKALPEWQDGLGGTPLHVESDGIAKTVFARALAAGDNMVIPRIGKTPASIRELVVELKTNGYTVHLGLVEIPPSESAKRAWSRFRTGQQQFIDTDYIAGVGTLPANTYAALKGEVDGYARIDNSGPPGQAVTVEQSASWPEAGEDAGRGGRGGDTGIRGSGEASSRGTPRQGDRPEDAAADQAVKAIDSESIDYDDGTSMVRHGLSDGSFVDVTPGLAEHWRPATAAGGRTVGRIALKSYGTLEEAIAGANTRTVTPTPTTVDQGDEALAKRGIKVPLSDIEAYARSLRALARVAKSTAVAGVLESEAKELGRFSQLHPPPQSVLEEIGNRLVKFANSIREAEIKKSVEQMGRALTSPAAPAVAEAKPEVTKIGKYEVGKNASGWFMHWTDPSGAGQGRSGLKTRDEAVAMANAANAKDEENLKYRRATYPMALSEWPAIRNKVVRGELSADEHKEMYRWLIRSEAAIKEELSKKTLKELSSGFMHRMNKGQIIESVFRRMVDRFVLGESITYQPFSADGTKNTYSAAVNAQVESITDEKIAAYREKINKAVEENKKALENPETLDEFQLFIAKKGESALSLDQRKRRDELIAELEMRDKTRPDVISKVDTGSVVLTYKEGFHEKQQIPLHIVQMTGRVPDETYRALVAAAKKLGGWWSNFKKDSTGFQFKTKEAADEFIKINQQSITTEKTDATREVNQAQETADRLIAMADEKAEAADNELNRDRNTNTVRRARMAESAEASARKAKQMAETLANIAEAIKSGAVKALKYVKNMKQLEEIERMVMLAQREYWYSLPEESRRAIDPEGQWWNIQVDENVIAKVKMPMPEPSVTHLQTIAEVGLKTSGIKREAAKVDKLWRNAKRMKPDGYVVTIDSPYDFTAVKAVASRLKTFGSAKYAAEAVHEALMHHQRIADLGFKSSEAARTAVREYVQYRAGRQKPDAIREMERALIGTTVGVDFFPTPPSVATDLVEKADIEAGMKVLEPSAGNGRIADAIKTAGVEPDVVEMSSSLRAILTAKGHNVVAHDFTDYNPGPIYDRIVMNPPFSNRMDVEHVRHAYELLKPGGRIVAVMSEGPFFGSDKKAAEFREWLDGVGVSEKLEEGTFLQDKSGLPTTGVNTRMVVIDKPNAGEVAQPAPKMTISYGSTEVSKVDGPTEAAPSQEPYAVGELVTWKTDGINRFGHVEEVKPGKVWIKIWNPVPHIDNGLNVAKETGEIRKPGKDETPIALLREAQGTSAPDFNLTAAIRRKTEMEKEARSTWMRANDDNKVSAQAKADQITARAEKLMPEIVAAIKAEIGEAPGSLDTPEIRGRTRKHPAKGSPQRAAMEAKAKSTNDAIEAVWADERALGSEISGKQRGTRVREKLEKQLEVLKAKAAAMNDEWTAARDALYQAKLEDGFFGPDEFRKIGVIAKWFPGKWHDAAAYLTKAAAHVIELTADPVLTPEIRKNIAERAAWDYMESPLHRSLTDQIETGLYVATKRLHQDKAKAEIEATAPLQSSERSRAVKEIENLDDPDKIQKVVEEYRAMARKRDDEESAVAKVREATEAAERKANTEALSDPSKMRVPTAKQSLGTIGVEPGAKVNSNGRVSIFMEHVPAKMADQVRSLPVEEIPFRGTAMTAEQVSTFSHDLMSKADKPVTVLGAIASDEGPRVLVLHMDGTVEAYNGKFFAFFRQAAEAWKSSGPQTPLVAFDGKGRPLGLIMPIGKNTHPVEVERAKSRAAAGWKDASQPPPATHKPTAAQPEKLDDSAFPTLEDLGISSKGLTEARGKKNTEDTEWSKAAAAAEAARKAFADDPKLAEKVEAKIKRMAGADVSKGQMRSWFDTAYNALMREDPEVRRAQARVEAARVGIEKHRAEIADQERRLVDKWTPEIDQKYRDALKNKRWWQLFEERRNIERAASLLDIQPSSDPRHRALTALLDEMQTEDITTGKQTGEILPVDYKPGSGNRPVNLNAPNQFKDLGVSIFGASPNALRDRHENRGKATYAIVTEVHGSKDRTTESQAGRWSMMRGAQEAGFEAIKRIINTLPEFGLDPVLTVTGNEEFLSWSAGNESYKIVNPFPTGTLKDGDTVYVNTETYDNKSNMVAVLDDGPNAQRQVPKSLMDKIHGLARKAERAADAAIKRMNDRAKDRGTRLNSMLTPGMDPRDARDVVIMVVSRAVQITGDTLTSQKGRALTATVNKVIADVRPELAQYAADIRRAVVRAIKAMRGDPDQFDRVLSEIGKPRETKAQRRRDAKAGAQARAGAVRSLTEPAAENPTVTPTEALKGSLKAQEKATGRLQRKAEAEVRRLENKVLDAAREGQRQGWMQAAGEIKTLEAQVRAGARRLRDMAALERRGGIDEQRAVQDVRDGIRQAVMEYAKKLPPKVRGKLVGSIVNAVTPAQYVAALRRLEKESYRNIGRMAWSGIARQVKGKKLKTGKGMTDAVRSKIQEQIRAANALRKTMLDPASNTTELQAGARGLLEVYQEIRTLVTAAASAYEKIDLGRRISAYQAAQQLVGDIVTHTKKANTDGEVKDPEVSKLRQVARKFRDIRNAVIAVEGLKGARVLHTLMYDHAVKAERGYLSELRDRHEDLERAVLAAGFDSVADAIEQMSGRAGRGVTSYVTATLGGESRKITLGDALALVAHYSDPQTKALIGTGEQSFNAERGTGVSAFQVTPDEVEALTRKLDPKHVEMIGKIKDIFEGMRDAAFKARYMLTGVEPEAVPGRWPRRRNMQQSPAASKLPDSVAEWINAFIENDGMFESRVANTTIPIVLENPLSVALDQIEKSAKMAHLGLPTRDAANVLLNPEVRTAIVERFGLTYFNDLKSQLMAFSRAEVALRTGGARAAQALNQMAATSNIALNPKTWAKNALSVIRLLPWMRPDDIAAGMRDVIAGKATMTELVTNSGYFWDRYTQHAAARFSSSMLTGESDRLKAAGMSREFAAFYHNLAAGDVGGAGKALRRASARTLMIVNFFDGLVARTAYAGAKRAARRAHPDWTEARITKAAAVRAETLIRETQNSSSPLDAAMGPTQYRESAMSALTLFTSDSFKARNRISRAFTESKSRGAAVLAAEVASVVAGAYASRMIGGAIASAFAAAFGWDDEDGERIIAEYLSPTKTLLDSARDLTGTLVPIVGSELFELMRSAASGRPLRRDVVAAPGLEMLNEAATQPFAAASAISKAIEGDDEAQAKATIAVGRLLNEALGVAGINPLAPFVRAGLREAAEAARQ